MILLGIYGSGVKPAEFGYIFASYVKFKDNKEADLGSRQENVDCEWEVSPAVFS